MKLVIDILEERISAAMAAVAGVEDCAAIVRPAADPRFGDYQVNGVMPLAKKLKTNPRKLAEEVVKKLDLSDMCGPPEVAGPGFINLRLKPGFIAGRLLDVSEDAESLAVDKPAEPKTIVVDFSSPNIAKQMHVGHLRSTIIGDCICRMLEFLGHKVIRQNHIGDWGTQFGKVILALWHVCMAENLHEKDEKPYYSLDPLFNLPGDTNITAFRSQIINRHQEDWLADSKDFKGDGELYFRPFLEQLSKRSKALWPALLEAYQYVNLLDEFFKEAKRTVRTRIKNEDNQFVYKDIPYESLSRYITVMLQQGGQDNEQEIKAWKEVRRLTLDECNRIYERLSIQLTDEHALGESFYKDMLPDVVEELKQKGTATESDGAVCVFPEGFKTKEGKRLPFIIRKSDGAYLYATTDLAALRYRVNELKTDAIVYVTDARQKLHFEMLFAVARMAGWDIRQETGDRRQEAEDRRLTPDF